MSYEAFRYIFIIALVLCCVMFVVSVVLFIVLNIPKIINDLSGRTAKKAIQDIREQNEKTGHKSYQVSQVNRERGKLTDKISHSGRIVSKNPSSQLGYSVETAKIAANTEETSVIQSGNETSVLSQDSAAASVQNETSVLVTDETTCLPNTQEAGFASRNTDVLSETAPINGLSVESHISANFRIEFEITYIHTNEVIDIGGV